MWVYGESPAIAVEVAVHTKTFQTEPGGFDFEIEYEARVGDFDKARKALINPKLWLFGSGSETARRLVAGAHDPLLEAFTSDPAAKDWFRRWLASISR